MDNLRLLSSHIVIIAFEFAGPCAAFKNGGQRVITFVPSAPMAPQIFRAAEQRASTLTRLRVEQVEVRDFLDETIREVSPSRGEPGVA